MAFQLIDLERSVLSTLGEAYNSNLGDLPTGTGGAPTIPTIITSGSAAATVKTLLNDGAAEMARTCYPVPDTATYTWLVGERVHLLSAFTPTTTGYVPWAVRGVKFGSTALTYCDRSALERAYPSFTTDANGTPAYWYRDGNDFVGLYPKPSASSTTVTIDNYSVPVPLAAYNDPLAWIPDDLTRLLVWYACAKLALKNMEDASLAPRAEVWQGLYNQGRMDLWLKIDKATRKSHFPVPPMTSK